MKSVKCHASLTGFPVNIHLISHKYIYLELWKPGQQTCYNFSQLALSNSLTYVHRVACLCVLFFVVACFVVRDLFWSGCRQNYYLPPLPSWFFFPTHSSFFHASDSYLKSARASSWFGCRLAVLFYILVTLRKVSRRASCKALRWDKVITIRRVCIVQYHIIFSFHLAKRINHTDPGWDRKVRYCSLF